MKEVQEEKTKRMLYPWLVMLVGAVLLLITLLLPYASSTKEHKEMPNVSLVEYVRIYATAASYDGYKDAAVATVVIIVIFAVLSLLTMLLSVLKKTIGVIVFDFLALISFHLIHFDFADRGVLPSNWYNWGIASCLGYIAGIAVIAGAVWMIVVRRKAKRIQQV